jgi:hypothetical protein
MFFYLFYNSNLIQENEGKLIKIFTYGIILYVVLHLLINSILSNNIFIGYYFWLIFIVDCVSVSSIIITESNGELLINNIRNTENTTDTTLNTDTIYNKEPEQNIDESHINLKKKEVISKKTTSTEIIDENNDIEFANFIKDLNKSDNNNNNNSSNNNSNNYSNNYSNNLETMIRDREMNMNTPNTDNHNKQDDAVMDEREILMKSLRNNLETNKQESDIDIDLNDFDELIK